MNLLYVWNKAYSGTKKDSGFLLTSRYEIKFDESERQLSIQQSRNLSVSGFWGEHIYDVMAVVGHNGAGKTRLAYSIMGTLDAASQLIRTVPDNQQKQVPFFLVFEDNTKGEPVIKIFASNLELTVKTSQEYELRFQWEDLDCFKFAYFTDALSLTDYMQNKYGVVHDGSLGGGIRQTFRYNQEMHYIDRAMSPIINYFDAEMDDILEFVCFNRKQEGIPFVLPQWVTFTPKNYEVNLNYISEQLDKMKIPHGKGILQEKCAEILRRYRWGMQGSLAVHLMLNLFKTACIPQGSEQLEEKAEIFLDKVVRLECRDEPFDAVLELLEQLEPEICDPKISMPYKEALVWLTEQPALKDLKFQQGWALDLIKNPKTVKKLYEHYRETKFPFPYFSISFGLSTGEYALLRRFVRINKLLSREPRNRGYVMNNLGVEKRCRGLMLYFDEADQSMHPEWQREYLDGLLQFISAQFETCSVQLIIAAHSPIMLSDIPRSHVLYLQHDDKGIRMQKRDVRTFGNNIHSLFLDSFFLENGTMGAFAKRKINEIAHKLQAFGSEAPKEILDVVEEIGDDVIRGKLQQMSHKEFPHVTVYPKDETLNETIGLLERQVAYLNDTIRKLERMKHDQD